MMVARDYSMEGVTIRDGTDNPIVLGWKLSQKKRLQN